MTDTLFHCPSCEDQYPYQTQDGCCLRLECFGEPLRNGPGGGTGTVRDPEGIFDRGWRLCDGGEGEQDEAEAARLFRMAAEMGHVQAQHNLGVMYANGIGTAQDAVEAVVWYRMAAERGHADAQNNLGVMYGNGSGVEQNAAEAVRLYRMAAIQGNANAQSNLGMVYANGSGVEQDLTEALRWNRLAAEQGNAEAQERLSTWSTDHGVDPSPQDAPREFKGSAPLYVDKAGHVTTRLPPLEMSQPDIADGNGDKAAPSWGANIGRNAPCPCGSDRKYKHCHGKL